MDREDAMLAIAQDEAHLVRLFSRVRSSPLLETTLTMQQLKVLLLLDAAGPMMSHELGTALGIAPASVTGLVDRLADRGLVHRVADLSDRRARRVHLTDEGATVVQRLLAAGAEHRVTLLSRLDDDALGTVAAAFAALRRAAEQVHGHGPTASSWPPHDPGRDLGPAAREVPPPRAPP